MTQADREERVWAQTCVRLYGEAKTKGAFIVAAIPEGIDSLKAGLVWEVLDRVADVGFGGKAG